MGTFSDRVDGVTAHFEKAFFATLGKRPAYLDQASDSSIETYSTKSDSLKSDSRKSAKVATNVAIDEQDGLDSEADRRLDVTSEVAPQEPEEMTKKKRYFTFLKSPRFWLAFFVGQVLSLCITCTNTLTTEMGNAGTSMPLLQNMLNYALLAVVYNPVMWYKYGFKKWFKILVRDSWRFFFLAFVDVQGNYFVVLAYEYTNMLSAALLDNFAIVVVVILSFVFLHVRYHWSQYLGILVTVGGMALLIVSDRLTGKDYHATDHVKGDLFVLLGASCYGFSNTFEEFLVSERPLYEVLGMLGFWASGINGVQMAIFGRKDIQNAKWTPKVGGYLTGYTLVMFLLYHLAPFMFRISSAAFYNLNVLTSDFWSLLVGIEAFGYYVYWLYPVGFVCTVIGIVCYCAAPMSDMGEAVKPWLGENQERGINGIGTARKGLGVVEDCENSIHSSCETSRAGSVRSFDPTANASACATDNSIDHGHNTSTEPGSSTNN